LGVCSHFFWVACNIVNLCEFFLGVGYYLPWMLDSLYNASKSLFEYTKDYGLQNLCCFLQVWNHVYTIFGQLKKKGPSSFDNYDGGLSVHICGSQQNQITCSNIYSCILKFCENSNNYQ